MEAAQAGPAPAGSGVGPGYVDLDLDCRTAEGGEGEAGAGASPGAGAAAATEPQLYGRADACPRGTGASPGGSLGGAAPLPTVRPPEEALADAELQVTRARHVSIISMAASLVAAVLGLGIGLSEAVLSLVGFGMESLLDGISSALVLWRFKRPKKREHADLDEARRHSEERDAKRERNSAVGIGATFLASACLLLVSSVVKLAMWDPSDPEHATEESAGAYYGTLVSWPSALVFGVLAYVKFQLARELQSQVLEKDALCSVLGAVLALICAVASLIELASSDNPKGMELVDSGAGGVIALLLGAEGARTLWHNLPGLGARAHQPMP